MGRKYRNIASISVHMIIERIIMREDNHLCDYMVRIEQNGYYSPDVPNLDGERLYVTMPQLMNMLGGNRSSSSFYLKINEKYSSKVRLMTKDDFNIITTNKPPNYPNTDTDHVFMVVDRNNTRGKGTMVYLEVWPAYRPEVELGLIYMDNGIIKTVDPNILTPPFGLK